MTCVVSFRAVGNIMVVAMLIVPSSVAWMLSDRLNSMFFWSLMIAVCSSVLGHGIAISLPHVFGFKSANSAAMVAVVSGCILIAAIFFGTKRGLLWRWINQRKMLKRILAEDILALFYRHVESKRAEVFEPAEHSLSLDRIASKLQRTEPVVLAALAELTLKNWINSAGGQWCLTQAGYRQAQVLVRTHRLWEHYLREETSIADPRLHATAESLEHYTSSELRESLAQVSGGPTVDPHGKAIPPESIAPEGR
jgi:Mn-dependent DtxR family transcriptional regulator